MIFSKLQAVPVIKLNSISDLSIGRVIKEERHHYDYDSVLTLNHVLVHKYELTLALGCCCSHMFLNIFKAEQLELCMHVNIHKQQTILGQTNCS